jgi:probable addiction module antidote protein
MARRVKVSELPEFDLAAHLRDDEDVAAYLSVVLEEGDADELVHALGIAARARGMTEISKASGITREALYRALRAGAQPRFDTVAKVCAALGLKLAVRPARQSA